MILAAQLALLVHHDTQRCENVKKAGVCSHFEECIAFHKAWTSIVQLLVGFRLELEYTNIGVSWWNWKGKCFKWRKWSFGLRNKSWGVQLLTGLGWNVGMATVPWTVARAATMIERFTFMLAISDDRLGVFSQKSVWQGARCSIFLRSGVGDEWLIYTLGRVIKYLISRTNKNGFRAGPEARGSMWAGAWRVVLVEFVQFCEADYFASHWRKFESWEITSALKRQLTICQGSCVA